MHGYKTFSLCVLALALYFVGGYLTGHGEAVVENAEWFLVAVASLYAGNDVAGALRERARRPAPNQEAA